MSKCGRGEPERPRLRRCLAHPPTTALDASSLPKSLEPTATALGMFTCKFSLGLYSFTPANDFLQSFQMVILHQASHTLPASRTLFSLPCKQPTPHPMLVLVPISNPDPSSHPPTWPARQASPSCRANHRVQAAWQFATTRLPRRRPASRTHRSTAFASAHHARKRSARSPAPTAR